MDNSVQSSLPDVPAVTTGGGSRSVLLVIIGVVLLLGGVLWSLPVIAYTVFAERAKDYIDLLLNTTSFTHRMIVGTVLGSAFGSLVFGLGLLWSAKWARLGGIIFLFLQYIAFLIVLSIAVNGITDADGAGFFLEKAQGYSGAACVTVLNGLLITLLLLARRKKAG